jgi:CelD/BcsL family acetyltransferase involved in cellulose biosynthesis
MTAPVRSERSQPDPRLGLEIADSEERWMAACAASGQPVTAFHTWGWLKASAAMAKSTLIAAVMTRDGADVGVLPLIVRRRGVFATLNCVPFPYCGPLVADQDLADCLELIVRQVRRLGVIRVTVQFPPGHGFDDEAAAGHGFTVTRSGTYVIDTSVDADTLWSRLTSECRRRVRLAKRNGIEITTEVPATALGDFEQQVFTDRGLRSGYAGGLSQHLRLLSGAGVRARTVGAVRDGELLGISVTLASHTEALGWMGGVFPEHRNSHAGYALYWDAIQWAHAIGTDHLDMVGVPNEGIAKFKKQFGGTLEPCVTAQYDTRTASFVYGARRRLSRRPGESG